VCNAYRRTPTCRSYAVTITVLEVKDSITLTRKFHYSVHKISLLTTIVNQLNPSILEWDSNLRLECPNGQDPCLRL
jgi:hypothetical protein